MLEESIQALNDKKIGESGFYVVGNKIVIYGTTLDELVGASNEFVNMLNKNARLDENKKPVFEIAKDAKISKVETIAMASLPRPDVKSKLLLCDAGDGSRLWVAENCTAEDFNKYVTDLKNASFTLYNENQIYKNNNTNDKTQCNMYATLTKDDIIVNVWYTVDGCLRITADQGFDLIPKTTASYQTVSESGLTMVGTGMQSELLFFRLVDGRFVVIDGGFYDATAEVLYDALKAQAPDPNNIKIACWIFTHSHEDHVGAFRGIAKNYNKLYADTLTIESLMYNFPGAEQEKSPQALYNVGASVRGHIAKTFPNITRYKAHPGNELQIANMRIEVLGSHESYIFDKYPEHYNRCNLMLKITVDGTVICIEGDTGEDDNNTLAQTYGTYLRCNILQAAHHGGGGGTVQANLLFAPETVLYVTTESRLVDGRLGETYNQALINVNKNPNFKEYVCHNTANTYFSLPYTPGSYKILNQNPLIKK